FSPKRLLLSGWLVKTVAGYTWPNPRLDALEHMRWDTSGYNAQGMELFIGDDCTGTFGGLPTGRTAAADWIRNVHDMATHDVSTGKGGMDGSISFEEEQARAENPGLGFSESFRGLKSFSEINWYTSLADTFALATIVAVEKCGGPQIDFRGGRTDATEPNESGVPEPDQDLDSHIASFAKQGFNVTEMIGLVACGHTIGGVQHATLPDIVPELNDPKNTESNQPFDGTAFKFDNHIATEYIDGTTKNSLVINLNDTLNSDKRIFSSDGNFTMSRFAQDADYFAQTCATLFAKMLNTVPTGVQLTDVIEPLSFKPSDIRLDWIGNGTIKLGGLARLFNANFEQAPTVVVRWKDRSGVEYSDAGVTLYHDSSMIGSSLGGRISNIWYQITAASNQFSGITFPEEAGISSLAFDVTTANGNTRTYDQDGIGFRVPDEVMWAKSTCLYGENNEGLFGRLDVAVRRDVAPRLTRVWARNVMIVNNKLEYDVPRITGGTSTAGSDVYEIWSLNINSDNFDQNGIELWAEIDGEAVRYSMADNWIDFGGMCAS
ncbi:putative L-ascorbate oxidase, partial [Auriculariales sp. MPI-PUGE-AT-0066]